eukprot:9473177-Ditylum_brightwellii.AAC.1
MPEPKKVENQNRNPRRPFNRRRTQGLHNNQIIRNPKFKGRTPELKGHIYDAGYALQASQFITTTKELAEYAGRTCSNAGEIRLAILKQEEVKFKLPTMDLHPDLKE